MNQIPHSRRAELSLFGKNAPNPVAWYGLETEVVDCKRSVISNQRSHTAVRRKFHPWLHACHEISLMVMPLESSHWVAGSSYEGHSVCVVIAHDHISDYPLHPRNSSAFGLKILRWFGFD